MIIATLVLLGLCFGSFVNALVWRLHQQSLPKNQRKAGDKELSIRKGRSICVNCGHMLRTGDLIPVLSWIKQRGKCRYCSKPILWQYPAIELAVAALFVLSYIFWPESLNSAENALLFTVWLAALTGLTALVVYDIRWMLLPNKIIAPLVAVVGLVVLLDSLFIAQSSEPLISSLAGALVGGGLFYVIFQVSKGRWIGGGDVKLGFLLGLLVGDPVMALMVLFLASLLGTVLILPLVALKKIDSKARIPFGPFLILAAVIVRLFGQDILEYYLRFVGL